MRRRARRAVTQIVARVLSWLDRRAGVDVRRRARGRILGREVECAGGIPAAAEKDDAWLVALGRDASLFFDVGCNLGLVSLRLLISSKIRAAVLVDPNPLALSMAAENMIRNGFEDRTRLKCAFVGDGSVDTIEFYTIHAGAAGSVYASHAKTASSLGLSYEVPTTTLDRLIQEMELVPDLVKIDVEGAEVEVLSGATHLASLGRTRFFVEVHSPAERPMKENADAILSWCVRNGYVAWYLAEMKRIEDPQAVAHRGRCHWLLLPGGVDVPGYLRSIREGAPAEAGLAQERTG